MINIHTFIVNPFDENTYVIADNETKQCAVIDAGIYSQPEQKNICTFIEENKYTVKYLLNTHGHIDHILGIKFLKDKFNAAFLMHNADLYLIEKAVEHGSMYGFTVQPPPAPDYLLTDEQILKLGNIDIKVIHIPGHTPGCVAFYIENDDVLFSGDTLFRQSIGRTDLPGGNYHQIIDSIKNKLLTLPDNTKVFPGHGNETSIATEKEHNPFLK